MPSNSYLIVILIWLSVIAGVMIDANANHAYSNSGTPSGVPHVTSNSPLSQRDYRVDVPDSGQYWPWQTPRNQRPEIPASQWRVPHTPGETQEPTLGEPATKYGKPTWNTDWENLSNSQQMRQVLYPLITIISIVLLLGGMIAYVRFRERHAYATASSPFSAATVITYSPRLALVLSCTSLLSLIAAWHCRHWSFAYVGHSKFAGFGAQWGAVDVASPYTEWADMIWTGNITQPCAWFTLMINLAFSIATIAQIAMEQHKNQKQRITSRALMTGIGSLLATLTIIALWMQLHTRLLDPELGKVVVERYSEWSHTTWSVTMGWGLFFLAIALSLQLWILTALCRQITVIEIELDATVTHSIIRMPSANNEPNHTQMPTYHEPPAFAGASLLTPSTLTLSHPTSDVSNTAYQRLLHKPVTWLT